MNEGITKDVLETLEGMRFSKSTMYDFETYVIRNAVYTWPSRGILLFDKEGKDRDRLPNTNLLLGEDGAIWHMTEPKTGIRRTYIIDKGGQGKRVYISGAVTGLPYEEAEKTFAEAEAKLLMEGYDAVNPVKFGLNDGWGWADYMTRDLAILKSCEVIYLLNGWEQSHGARTEYEFARGMGLEIIHQNGEGQTI